jgi:glycosyltransferase involved in cell wall biosynthesis
MVKTLHLVYSGLGGPASVVFSLIEADKKKILNQNILFIGPYLNKYFCNKCRKFLIQYNWIKTIKYSYFFSFFKTFLQIRKYKPNVILIHNYYILPCILYKVFYRRVKIIYVNHKSLNLLDAKDRMMKYFKIFIDKFVFLNKKTIFFAKKNFYIPVKKICLITNGVNIDFFSPVHAQKGKVFKIGMACRVNKIKCYDLIANALNHSLLKHLNIEFSLAGEGEDLIHFKERVKNMGLQDKIKFVGNLNEINLKKWYAQLNAYIQASIGEGSPISLIQAMSMGIPAMGSRVNGINEILKKKYVGQLFKNSTEDLAKKINNFYFLNKNKILKYAKNQREYVICNHNYKIMLKKYIFIIKNI